MPYKFNADHRDKIPKQKHRVTNWSTYNEGLRHRGDLTGAISESHRFGDTLMGRWKVVIGSRLKARPFEIRKQRPRLTPRFLTA